MSRIKIGLAGLGYWGPNLARNFDETADLTWLSDLSEENRARFAPRYPNARMTADFDELLADPELEAVVVATPVVTHYELARAALEAGKHVFVEKPMAVRAAEAEELVALAEERGLVLMPGHLLLYHPGVRKLKELVDAGELGDVLYLYGNRQNFGKIRREENALSSLGAHDLSVILHLVGEEPTECWARGESFLGEVEDVVFCYLRFPSGKVAHMHLSWLDPHKKREMTVVGTKRMVVFDDMELERKITIYDKATERARRVVRRVADANGRHLLPEDPERRAAAARGAAFPRSRAGAGRPARGRPRRRGGRAGTRAAAELARADPGVTVAATAVVYPGTVLGEGCVIGDHAVVGKQPALSRSSTAKREPLPPLELGPGTIVSAGAVVFAGTKIGANCIVGDQSCVRERCELGDDVVVGRGSLVENDTTIGARTKIQADAYVTAYSTLEEDVFIAPCVVTTNDNFMGRTEKRHALRKGPTIRRGARVGGGAVLLPGIEVGEEAFVGAGAVVLRDVPARALVVGNPARQIRDGATGRGACCRGVRWSFRGKEQERSYAQPYGRDRGRRGRAARPGGTASRQTSTRSSRSEYAPRLGRIDTCTKYQPATGAR